ncbi:hypothetical protein SELMODRAFT_420276 [Selaginella moellendorffii]|uniref:CBF1-interacting co-repressor CIR N-terminal domain-containing protein n=2 Tax=Selaginella moellendorffii TaxID=88036 RepID=D8SBH2_SELML|nr:hypothetical protein SELMODRAFT_420276 [Selaginella moellendorffii]
MKKAPVQEAELKNKAGTAWSHSYLNQKPWHPLSYPNQRRKWIAEQTHLQRERRNEDVAREFAQEQEFYRQTAMLSKKEQEKAEAMKALSFMYLRPPGYNAESARAAEIADERKKLGDDDPGPSEEYTRPQPEKKKARVLDIYGRPVPTEEEFPALKNAPRLDTGTIARAKPFGVEIRNVKCARCGSFGHQSGDRECTMKDTIMPSEQARLRRDDPLNAMVGQTENNKWELKQQLGGMSPPRGGFKPDDPNQQIIAEDDVYDEYGGFLGEGLADALASFSRDRLKRDKKRHRKEKRHKRKKRRTDDSSSDSEDMEPTRKHGHRKDGREGGATDEEGKPDRDEKKHSRRLDDSSDSDSKHGKRHHRNSNSRNRDGEKDRHRDRKDAGRDHGGGSYDSRNDHNDAVAIKSRRSEPPVDKHNGGRGSRKDDEAADTSQRHSRHHRRWRRRIEIHDDDDKLCGTLGATCRKDAHESQTHWPAQDEIFLAYPNRRWDASTIRPKTK